MKYLKKDKNRKIIFFNLIFKYFFFSKMNSSYYANQPQFLHNQKEEILLSKVNEDDFLSKKPNEIQLINLNKRYKTEIRYLNNLSN